MAERVFTQTFGVAAAILEREGKVLLVRENNPAHPDHGKWNQPAGWIEVGEHPIEAAKREIREETGYDFTPTHLLGIYALVRRDSEKALGGISHGLKFLFVGTFPGRPSAGLEGDISEVYWFTPEEIFAMDNQTLRDSDIKDEVRDYLTGKRYPLELITHTVQE